ncbi:coagulation factor VII-like [Carassius carassius]|uniref:coagulation factor VII-like n=1 Tax=Carassius carassius TaxID=217509 RepID=UPI00286847CD|nr:coagulation factor VII-like [Carassius carassius]
MSLLSGFYVLLGLYSCHSATVFVGKDEAHGGLIRTKRANSGWFEELKMGNLERECLEEKCSYEEAREVFEHAEATNEFWKIYNVKDHCASNPCENNGLCSIQNAESYTCLCSPGFSGRNCEQEMKDIPDSCLYNNGGCEHFCTEKDAQRSCSCADGYTLGSDGQKCLTKEAFPCGKVPLLQGPGAAVNPKDDARSRIVGGAECPKGHCPWQVLLKYGQKGFCGGVIYKPTWILTAAHCLEKLNVRFLNIVAGEHDIQVDEGTEQVIQVEQMLEHPNYNSSTSDNDIALLRLRKPIVYSTYAVPVCLPLRDTAERELWAVSKHTVSGWGKRSEDGPTSRLLRRLLVPRIRSQECIEISNVALTSNMFCAGYIEGKQDSCKGDSGGPLVTHYRNTTFLLGIVSWGKGCARPGSYGIYTRVSNYLQWIHQQTANSTAATQ